MSLEETLSEANRLKLQDQYAIAIDLYQQILDSPEVTEELQIDTYLGLAETRLLQGNLEKALFIYSQLLGHDSLPDTVKASVLVQSAVILEKVGQEEAALERYDSGISFYLQLASKEFDRLNYGMADYYYQTIFSIYPKAEKYTLGDLILAHAEVKLRIFRDLAMTANMFRYNRDVDKAKVFGWKALMYAIEIINQLVEYRVDYEDAIKYIMEYFPYARYSLLAEKDEFIQVVELKLQELEKFFRDMTDDIPDDPSDVDVWVQTQTESIRFMVPKSPPSFMLLTPDGRFISYIEATEDLSTQNTPINHLVVSLLTATREMFLQTNFSGSGLIEEIDMGEHSLIIRGDEHIIVVAIVTISLDTLRDFTTRLADNISREYSSVLKSWKGDSDSVSGLITLAKQMIRDDVIDNY